MRSLVIIDIQNDFIPGGALAVPNGDTIIPVINQIQPQFDLVVATQDWHPSTHKSFAANHAGGKVFDKIMLNDQEQTLWPSHCVQGTRGADFHSKLKTTEVSAIFRKGMNPEIDSYSGFYDNDHRTNTGLAGYLKARSVKDLYFCGLCADICVYYSICDAIQEGFTCYLIEDATCAFDNEKYLHKIKTELLNKQVKIIQSQDL